MCIRRMIEAVAPGLVFISAIVGQAGDAPKNENPRLGEITVRLRGRLTVAWKETDGGGRKVVYAAVKAGGASLWVDWNGCPVIHDELAADHLGSAFASAINAEITGQLTFRRKRELPHRPVQGIGQPGDSLTTNEPEDALCAVVVVETLHVQVEPPVSERAREQVRSTTFGTNKQ